MLIDWVNGSTRMFVSVFTQTNRLFRGIENNEFKLKIERKKTQSKSIADIRKCHREVPVIRNNKFISQHFVDAVFNLKFVFLQWTQIAVFVHSSFEIENEPGWTQTSFLPDQRAGARVLQKFRQEFQDIFFAENEIQSHEYEVIWKWFIRGLAYRITFKALNIFK